MPLSWVALLLLFAQDPTFSVDSTLALLRFHHLPPKGRLVSLSASDLLLLENGRPQTIALLAGGRSNDAKVPLQVWLLFDCSESIRMAGNLNGQVFETSLLAEFEHLSLAIAGFSDHYQSLAPLTRDPALLTRAMRQVPAIPTGGTPLFEHTLNALRAIPSSPGPTLRYLLVFSDGESNREGDIQRLESVVRLARERNVAVCPVLLRRTAATGLPSAQGPGTTPTPPDLQQALRIDSFLSLAAATGGQEFRITGSGAGALELLLAQLAAHLRLDYVAGYYPQPDPSGQPTRRHLRLQLTSKSLGRLQGGGRQILR